MGLLVAAAKKPPRAPKVHEQFFRFGVIGVLGFLVDVAVLYLSVYGFHMNRYAGRVASYLAAATCTWWLNRRFTFTRADKSRPMRQWMLFLSLNVFGGIINYLTYVFVVRIDLDRGVYLLIGVACGSLAGMIFNFMMSRVFVFRDI